MKGYINRFLKKNLNCHVVRFFESSMERAFALNPWLYKLRDYDLIIDVGANSGQFAEIANKYIEKTPMFCFEPIPDEYKELQSKFKDNSLVKTYNVALGSENVVRTLKVHQSTVSSSFLDVANGNDEVFHGNDEQVRSISVDVTTLKDILHETPFRNIFLKIDVQGFEIEVLEGAMPVFDRISLILIECSFVELYQGQPLFNDIYNFLSSNGYEYKGEVSAMGSGPYSEPIQADIVFVRKQ